MLVYKIKNHQIIAVECKEYRYPFIDVDGDTIRDNTHFLSQIEAYQNLIESMDLCVAMLTKTLDEESEPIQDIETQLINTGRIIERLKTEYKALIEGADNYESAV